MTNHTIGSRQMATHLLGPGDPQPVLRANLDGASDWLLLCDHAGNVIPRALGDLGVARADLDDHIGIDIGAWELTLLLADALDAEAIGQRYSRLVVDCNRLPGTATSIPTTSDRRAIPANTGLNEAEAAARAAQIFAPYHDTIAARIASKPAARLCAVHSFTRQLGDRRREVDIGIIHGPSAGIADSLLRSLATPDGLMVRRNEPYRIDFAGDYTLPVHGEAGGLDYIELEICQDLIGTSDGQRRIADLLAPALSTALHDSRL